ncbi:MAG: RNA methyltransferase [Flavobacteriaceae bacterium]|nr:RNA methyltransferase [Flavobacteriaceae bacterium]MDH3795604.1 RNA methyltransferase [Flavobacteriaceae bacterium]
MKYRKLANEELDRLDIEGFKTSEKFPVVLVLDNVRSLNNIGSIFRTADAFRIEKIYLCGITAKPPHRDIQKTALGATESVEWAYEENVFELLQKLKTEYKILAVEQTENAVLLSDFSPIKNTKYALVFGNEVKGIQQPAIDLCDNVLEIPQMGTKHSFNISVSVGILLWDLFTKTRS